MNTSVIEAIEPQKTTNLYDASKSIPDDEIRELVRLATFSPTAFHLQNWIVFTRRQPEPLAAACSALLRLPPQTPDANPVPFASAPRRQKPDARSETRDNA
jgi:nitroreductase